VSNQGKSSRARPVTKTGGIGKGQAGPGRPKGLPNKVTASIKSAISEAFDKLGGVPSLVRWGESNPDDFYALWGRLAPKEVEMSTPAGAALVIKVVRE
jgi:hypothetical protein